MAVSSTEVKLIIELIQTNAKANDDAHVDIVRRLDDYATENKKTFEGFAAHCVAREKTVNDAIEALKPKKYTPWQSVKGIAKVAALSLGETAVVVGLLKAFGVLD